MEKLKEAIADADIRDLYYVLGNVLGYSDTNTLSDAQKLKKWARGPRGNRIMMNKIREVFTDASKKEIKDWIKEALNYSEDAAEYEAENIKHWAQDASS